MFEVVPTILTADIEDFSQKISKIRGVSPRVQIDVIDGKFAENKTISLEGLRDLADIGDLRVDLHLMVDEPQGWIKRSLEIVPDRIVAHLERMSDPAVFISEVRESGVEAGLALDLGTQVESVREDILLISDLVVILGVEAGMGGQEFNVQALEKIKKVKKILGDFGKIGVDGGINEENIRQCKEAGANIFYIGKGFWEAGDLETRYNELLKLIS